MYAHTEFEANTKLMISQAHPKGRSQEDSRVS